MAKGSNLHTDKRTMNTIFLHLGIFSGSSHDQYGGHRLEEAERAPLGSALGAGTRKMSSASLMVTVPMVSVVCTGLMTSLSASSRRSMVASIFFSAMMIIVIVLQEIKPDCAAIVGSVRPVAGLICYIASTMQPIRVAATSASICQHTINILVYSLETSARVGSSRPSSGSAGFCEYFLRAMSYVLEAVTSGKDQTRTAEKS